MDKYTQELVKDVCQGNPGALTVIDRLQWFSKWDKMLQYFKDCGLVGGKLWARYKDDYHQDIYKFGHEIEIEMFGYYRGPNTAKFEKNRRIPKFT